MTLRESRWDTALGMVVCICLSDLSSMIMMMMTFVSVRCGRERVESFEMMSYKLRDARWVVER